MLGVAISSPGALADPCSSSSPCRASPSRPSHYGDMFPSVSHDSLLRLEAMTLSRPGGAAVDQVARSRRGPMGQVGPAEQNVGSAPTGEGRQVASLLRQALDQHLPGCQVPIFNFYKNDVDVFTSYNSFYERVSKLAFNEEQDTRARDESILRYVSLFLMSLLRDTQIVLYQPGGNATNLGITEDLLDELVSVWGQAAMVWKLDMFLTTAPPEYHVYKRGRHRRLRGEYCIAYIVLAELDWVGEAFASIQRGSWFKGSTKYLLAYTGRDVTMTSLASHPLLGSSYNLVVVSRVLQEGRASLLPHSSEAKLMAPSSSSSSSPSLVYQLLQMCPYCASGRPQVNLVNYWTSDTGFLSESPLYPDLFQIFASLIGWGKHRIRSSLLEKTLCCLYISWNGPSPDQNFQGHQFQVVTLVYEPFSCYQEEGGVLIPAGNCVDNKMLNEMSRTLNFTYVLVEPSDGQWGHRLENGSYTGVIGAVERLEADFSLNIAITQDREEKVDCTIGYHVEPITFATSKPRPLNQALALIRPFAPEVWVTFALTLIVSGPIYYLICTSSRRYDVSTSSLAPSMVKACLLIFGASFNQGVRWAPGLCPRMFVVTYVLAMLVTLTMYVAMLTATLTLPTLSPTLNLLEQLVNSDHTWGIQDLGAADFQLLKTSKVPLYQEVFRGLQPCPTLDECIRRARDTKYGFITWRTYLEDRIAVMFTSGTGERQLHVAKGDIFPVELGWAMNPGCPYRHAFNSNIRALIQSGFISKWLDDLINDPRRREVEAKVDKSSEEESQALGLHHLQGVFFVLLIGYSLSCLTLLGEVTLR
ncbi:uncharacterized protein [Panulirus ornatus]|uniref:uncharacterized protein n=1 Tax=Panulirus ornatus TaxID=150431 RepID=UPI003A8512DD